MKEHLQELKAGGRPMTKNELKIKELQQKIDRAISFIHILKNNLKDYTEYEEYTKIFNEMLNDILEALGDKE